MRGWKGVGSAGSLRELGNEPRRRKRILLASLFVVTGLFMAGAAGASHGGEHSCSQSCGAPCGGGCSISSVCNVWCGGGSCPGEVTCKHIPPGEGCHESPGSSVECKPPEQPPPGPCPEQPCPPHKTGDWVVLEYQVQPGLPPSDVRVLAASTPAFAAAKVREVLSTPAPGEPAPEGPDLSRPPSLDIKLAPHGECRSLYFHIEDRDTVWLPPSRSRRTALFWVESGFDDRVVDVLPLFADDEGVVEELEWVLLQRATLRGDEDDGPYGGFVSFSVGRDGSLVTYIFGGGSRISDEE
jgi:hypothetical protein